LAPAIICPYSFPHTAFPHPVSAKAGCLSSDDVSALIQAYLSERAESHRLALANQSMQVNAADWRDTRVIVCKLWQRLIDPSSIVSIG
jgi:glutamate-ammonia-ligase adenylyltransferase